MKRFLNDALVYFGLVALITLLWQLLEILFMGAIKPDIVDIIITATLAMSLQENLNHKIKA